MSHHIVELNITQQYGATLQSFKTYIWRCQLLCERNVSKLRYYQHAADNCVGISRCLLCEQQVGTIEVRKKRRLPPVCSVSTELTGCLGGKAEGPLCDDQRKSRTIGNPHYGTGIKAKIISH